MAIELQKSSPATQHTPVGGAWFERFKTQAPAIGSRERMFFTERLALLLDTGIPLHVALESLARQSDHEGMEKLVRQLREDVTGGMTFARALGQHSNVFPATYVNLIAAAETGGFLPIALERLREMEERREELRSTLKSALSYPIILMAFSFAVIVFVLVVVFPKFEEMFEMIRDQLPPTTSFLMAASDIMRRYWLGIILAACGAYAFAAAQLQRPEGRRALDRFMLRVPGLREIVIQLNIVQMLRVMGLSLANGVGLVEALRSAREAVSSDTFRGFLDRVDNGVSEGRGLASGFDDEPLVPELVKQMIETGEESGNLPQVMQRLADFYEREWRLALGMVSKVAEPAMLIVMGGVVGLIVSSLILPIFKLSRAVH